MKKIILPIVLLSISTMLISEKSMSQNVGIGTTTPASKLTVSADFVGIEQTNGTVRVGTFVGANFAQVGTITNHNFQLMTNNGSNQFILTTNGNVGIGVAAPSERLTILTGSTNYGLLQTDNTVSVGSFISAGSAGAYGTKSNHPLYFFTNSGAFQTALLQNGNFGIGTLTPADKLSVQTATTSYGITHTDGTVKMGTYVGTTGGSNPGGWLGTLTAHPLYFFTGSGSPQLTLTTDGLLKNFTGIKVTASLPSGSVDATAYEGTAPSAPFSYAFKGFALNGGYGIYTTAAGGASAAYFSGPVTVTGTFTNPSDRTLKTDIQDYTNALEKINRLKVKTYEFNAESKQLMQLPEGTHIGVIAQELQEVFPGLVSQQRQPIFKTTETTTADSKKVIEHLQTGTKEFLGVNYLELIPVLIKAVQEEDVKIKELEEKLAAYESRNK